MLDTTMLNTLHDDFECLVRDFNGVLLDRSYHGKGLHRTYLINFGDDEEPDRAVVKCFGPRSGPFNVFLRSLANFFTGRTGVYAKRRYKTERKVIEVWRENGFGTFTIIDDLPPQFAGRLWLVTRYADGVTLDAFLADQSVGQARKDEVMTRFWAQTARRQALALEKRQRRLIPSNPTLKHVMLMPDGEMLFFDFEVAFVRFASVKTLIGRELTGYVRSMRRILNTEQFNHNLKVMVRVFPEPQYLGYVTRVGKSLNPVIRLCQILGRAFSSKDHGARIVAAKALLRAQKEAACK